MISISGILKLIEINTLGIGLHWIELNYFVSFLLFFSNMAIVASKCCWSHKNVAISVRMFYISSISNGVGGDFTPWRCLINSVNRRFVWKPQV